MSILAVVLLYASMLSAAADWQTKEPAHWTDDDVNQILTDSPWSAIAKLYQSLDSPSGRPKSVRVTIQWQSALPVRSAMAKESGGTVDLVRDDALEEYVVIVTGLPAKDYGLTTRNLVSTISLDPIRA